MDRRKFVKNTTAASVVTLAAVTAAACQTQPEKVRSSFGPWLAMMMNEKRTNAERLAKKAGVDVQTIEDFLAGKIGPEQRGEEAKSLTVAVLTHRQPAELYPSLIESLNVHTDLRNWSATCDGGCCSWNLMID